jgi:putative colanic acid biosynthesis glycosyltransferase WcaI
MKVLLLNQCFYPDVVSTAQHLTDLALELARDGHQVTVVASSRGYDDPGNRFARREAWKGVTIRRIPCTGLGKKSRWRRAIDFASFLVRCAVRVLFLPRFDLVVAMTSPPLISFLAALLVQLRGGRFVFWVMDLNPDEAIAAGWLRKTSATARVLEALLSYSLKRADRIIVLDSFVRQRIADKGIADEKILVIPPWSHDDAIRYDQPGRMKFRAIHNLSDKYVVMYSGNHSPCHPLDTLLEAACSLSSHPEIAFCFVGGGSELEKVKSFAAGHKMQNVLCLPYQPMTELAGSLSAADMHVVVMGDAFVGIVHPCKIYNILSIGTPALYIGPAKSHITDIFSKMGESGFARSAGHGDVEAVTRHILNAVESSDLVSNVRTTTPAALAFSKNAVLPRLIEALQPVCDSPALYDSAVESR